MEDRPPPRRPETLAIDAPPQRSKREGRQTLDSLPPQVSACIVAISAPADRPDWPAALASLGFEPGETVRLLRRGPFGGDPLLVRVAGCTYALRRGEAACIRVTPHAGAATRAGSMAPER
jgi:ferrous iron transport protein A